MSLQKESYEPQLIKYIKNTTPRESLESQKSLGASTRDNTTPLSKQKTYDEFFNHSGLRNESHYLRHYVNPDLDPIKIKIKAYNDEEAVAETRTFLMAMNSEEKILEDSNILDDFIEPYRESLLEVPVSRMIRELDEEQINRERYAEERPREIPAAAMAEVNNPETLLWSDKYMPQNFFELLSDERTNREILTWLKAWDPVVFNRRIVSKNPKMKDPALTTNAPGQFQRNYLTYDLDDKKSLQILQNKIILLAGPPGSGKTTLARVLAKVCGYNPIEINASDERTSNVLIEKIENITRSETITKNTTNYKPSLLILDEVDGTAESEYSGAMTRLMKFIYGEDQGNEAYGQKGRLNRGSTLRKGESTVSNMTNPQDEDDENDKGKNFMNKDSDDMYARQDSGQKSKNNTNHFANKILQSKIRIKRPIIFICNDSYVKSLKELRKRALVFNFKKPETSKLMKRLYEICVQEKLLIDHDTLMRVCEQNDNDIRGCLNMLDFLARKKSNRSLKDDIFLAKKEMTKNYFDVIEDLMHIEKTHTNQHSSLAQKKPKFNIISYCFLNLHRNTEYSILSEGLFCNYVKAKQTDSNNLKRINDFMNSLVLSDTLFSSIFRTQHHEMKRYANLVAVQAHLSLATPEKFKIEFPRQNFEVQKAKKSTIQLYEGLNDALVPKMRPYYSKYSFPTQYTTYLYQAIQPRIDSTILNAKEKESLDTAGFIMLDFGIDLAQHQMDVVNRQGEVRTHSWLRPQIEKLILFEGVTIEQRFNEKLHMLLQSKYGYLKTQRMAKLLKEENEIISKPMEAEVPEAVQIEDELAGSIEVLEVTKKSKKRKERSETDPSAGFLYKYKEGFSNAVKYDLKMDFFFKSFNPKA